MHLGEGGPPGHHRRATGLCKAFLEHAAAAQHEAIDGLISADQPTRAPVNGPGRVGAVEPAVDLLGALAAEQGRARERRPLVQVRHRHALDLYPAAAAGNDQPLGHRLRHQGAAVDDALAHRDGGQVLGRVQNPGHLIGELRRLRRHHVHHGDLNRLGVEEEADMAVPALHHDASPVRAAEGDPGQVGGDSEIGAVVTHVRALLGRGQHPGSHRRREEVFAAIAGQFHQRASVGVALVPGHHEPGLVIRLPSGEPGHEIRRRQARHRGHRHLPVPRRHDVGRGGI